jgi:hypothetical protein
MPPIPATVWRPPPPATYPSNPVPTQMHHQHQHPMATTTGACHLDNPHHPAVRQPPTGDDQRRAVSNQRPAAKPDTINGQWSDRVGYHRGAAPRQDRS